MEAVYEPHRLHVEKSYGLVPWEKREDVPDWAREISLVAAVHCQHWTGYIFNDYEQVLENLKKIAAGCKNADEFKAEVGRQYPAYSGQNYLDMTAGFFFA